MGWTGLKGQKGVIFGMCQNRSSWDESKAYAPTFYVLTRVYILLVIQVYIQYIVRKLVKYN